MQVPERAVRLAGEPAVREERVVEIEQDTAQLPALVDGEKGKRAHTRGVTWRLLAQRGSMRAITHLR